MTPTSRADASAAASPTRPSSVLGLAILVSALAGVVVWLIMDALSRSSIGGATWSLRGNGALIVPLGLGPAILAIAWVGLAFNFRGRRWLGPALLAGVLTFVLEMVIGFGPVVLGAEAGQLNRLLIGVVVPVLAQGAGLALAFLTGALSVRGLMVSSIMCLLVIAATAFMAGLEFFLAPLILPLVVTAPLVILRRETAPWLIASLITVPIVLVGGFYLAAATLSSPS
jgi:hypothetical protein